MSLVSRQFFSLNFQGKWKFWNKEFIKIKKIFQSLKFVSPIFFVKW